MPPPPINKWEQRLMLLLRAIGTLDLCALAVVIMPMPTMASIHEALGLGRMPMAPVVEYLTRSSATLYAVLGALVWFVSYDVRRYRKLIRFTAFATILHGAILLGIDLAAGMPNLWTLGEAVGYFAPSVAVLWLLDRSMREQPVPVR